MRRIMIFILCLLAAACPVLAAAGTATIENDTQVRTDGECQVTLTLSLRLDSPVSGLSFPVPAKARDITVNATLAEVTSGDGVRNVDLSAFAAAAGNHTLILRYTLADAVSTTKNGLQLKMELLSGFAYPIEAFSFSVTLPGDVEYTPSFISTYYQDATDTILESEVSGAVISGSVPGGLRDSDTLTMTLSVSEEMFPQGSLERWSVDKVDVLMLSCTLLALVYWLICMRWSFPARSRCTVAPEGFSAGQVGCHLTGRKMDFSLMVISWAQLGYLQLELDSRDRVFLHKRMDMGNERSDFEMKYFRRLFGSRRTVEGTGLHYARVCRKANLCRPGVAANYHPNSGNPVVFRLLCACVGAISGVSLAGAFAADTGIRTVLSIFLGIGGTAAAWQMQNIGAALHWREKTAMLVGLACAALWLGLSYLTKEWGVALFVVPALVLSGFAAAYGGRRSDIGKHNLSTLLNLRHHLKTVDSQDLRAITRNNPDYFYQMAPWAIALCADRSFADRFGQQRLGECAYLVTGRRDRPAAKEWMAILRHVLRRLDARQAHLALDQLFDR